MATTLTRSMMGLAAGGLTALVIDTYLWPGTLFAGCIGVLAAVIGLAFVKPR